PGIVGQAFSFDGIDDFVAVPDSSIWAFGTNEFTIELWANFTAASDVRAFVASDSGPGTTNKWIFWLESGRLRFYIYSATAGDANIGANSFAPVLGQWYHLAVTRRGTNYTFYENGSVLSIDSDMRPVPDVPDASAPLTIGQAENLYFFGGRIDELAIYTRALSDNEIAGIYAAGGAGKCKPQ